MNVNKAHSKIILFAILGGLGCLAGAILGEGFLALTRFKPFGKPIVMLIDCSGSMDGESKINSVKNASQDLIKSQVDNRDLGIVAFDSSAVVISALSSDETSLRDGISSLGPRGGTNLAAGFTTASSLIPENGAFILLFTDGFPDDHVAAKQSADSAKKAGATIVAVGTNDADRSYLETLTGDPKLVLTTNPTEIGSAFKEAQKIISLNESSGSGNSLLFNAVRIGIWTGILSLGLAAALLCGQEFYLKRRLPTFLGMRFSLIGGFIGGLLAGLLGQMFFATSTSAAPWLVELIRIPCWSILGLLVGAGISWFVPNLSLQRAAIGGVLGGTIGAIGFGIFGLVFGELLGRLVGALILGACIGAMLAIVEAYFLEAWLEVQYGPREIRNVGLGKTPVLVGGNPALCQVFVPGTPEVALRYTLVDGRLQCEDVIKGTSSNLLPNDSKSLGKLNLIVRTKDGEHSNPQPKAEEIYPQKVDREKGSTRGEHKTSKSSQQGDSRTSGQANIEKSSSWKILIRGRTIHLTSGKRFNSQDIVGLETKEKDGAVAEVNSHPKDPKILGLRNLSTRTWTCITAQGETLTVSSGQNIKLSPGTQIDFGNLQGVIEFS